MSTIKYNYCKKTFLYRERLKMSAVAKPVAILKRERGNAIRALIALHGFVQQKLRLHTDNVETVVDLPDYCNRIVAMLEALGCVFVEFGRYLAHRPDLLHNDLTKSLQTVTHSGRTTLGSLDEILGTIAATELRSRFSEIDETPFDTRRFSQRYSGKMLDGQSVEIKVVRQLSADEAADLELLEHVQSVFQPVMLHANCFRHAVSEFRQQFAQALDCRRLAESLETLRYDASEIPSLSIPTVEHTLTTSQTIVMESVSGIRISRNSTEFRRRSGSRNSTGLGQQICELWLQLASDGSLVPVNMSPDNIIHCTDGTIAIVDGNFTMLPSKARESLQVYLSAVASDDAREAAESLLREFTHENRSVTHDQLLRILRQQVEPSKSANEHQSYLLQKMVRQWQLVVQHGCLPLRHFAALIQALQNLQGCADNDQKEPDIFLRAIKEQRSSQMVQEMAALFDPQKFMSDADKVSELFATAPNTLNRTLDYMSNGVSVRHSQHMDLPRQSSRFLVVTFAAIALVWSLGGEDIRPILGRTVVNDSTQILCLCFLVLLFKQL